MTDQASRRPGFKLVGAEHGSLLHLEVIDFKIGRLDPHKLGRPSQAFANDVRVQDDLRTDPCQAGYIRPNPLNVADG